MIQRVLSCNDLQALPKHESIISLSRGIIWIIEFADEINFHRQSIGERWRAKYPQFQIGIHTTKNEIRISKLITDKEVIENQYFFEQCAKDYRNLARKLINEFADRHHILIDPDYPMRTLGHTNRFGYEPIGKMGSWRYAFHGIHCSFSNIKTGQYIEVPLNFGLEFGQLDPYFFSNFIKTTESYAPLPTEIHHEYEDGKVILNQMIKLGKFEYVNSNWPNTKGIVVTDRDRIPVKQLSVPD